MPMGTLAADKRREAPSARSDRKPQLSSAVTSPGAQRAMRSPPASTNTSAASAGAPAHAASADAATALPADLPVAKSRLTLERVIGITSLSNAMVAVNPVTGEIAYAAGCIVVIYNLRRNKQVRYYRVEKSVACLCFSPSGQYLAIGEKGYLPAITIWDGTDGTLCAELQLHKFGVACMAFSRDGRYLLSAGLVHDQHLYAWDLRNDTSDGAMRGAAVGAAQLQEKVLAMDYCQDGNFFVTVGEKHFKFWFLDDHDEFLLTGYEINDVAEIQHRDAVMAAKSDATFTGVACGYGACRLKTFAVTSDGTLCCFGASCIMERLVSLEATHGNAISVTEAYVAVAGSSSIVRLFDPATLEYRATMPFPPPFGSANAPHDASSNLLHPDVPHRYPAVLAVRVTGAHVIVLYSDRSWFVYDVSDTQNAHVERSFLSHSGSIRDLAIAGRVRGLNAKGKLVYAVDDNRRLGGTAVVPNGTFVTCSDDNTLRLWHMDLHKQTKNSRFSSHDSVDTAASADDHAWKNPFSLEMLGVVYHDSEADFAHEDSVVLGGTCSSDEVPDIHSPSSDHGPVNGLRAIAIHPSQTQVVAGDKDGNLIVLELPGLTSVREIGAHNTEVHCLAFSDSSGDDGQSNDNGAHHRRCLMASGGRDCLVHVYDCNKDLAVIETLDNHSGAVTSLAFTRDGTKLLSCGADKTIVFSHVHADGNVVRYNSLPCSGGKVFDMALTTDSERVLTSCNNRLDVHSVATGKHVVSHHVGEQHRIAVCPANYCVAMSGSLADKTIHVVDLATGETLADATGHGEAITAVAFTPDCRRLVSTSSDGCLFVWRLSEEIQSAMKARLPRVTEAHAPMPVPPSIAKTPATPATAASPVVHDVVVMPPPAPPIAAPKAIRAPAVHAHGAKTRTPTAATAVNSGVDTQSSSKQALPPSGRRKSGSHADASVIAAALAIPKKSSDAKDTKGWKSRAAPAPPGPMAKIPMEDWMRTRESAKRTVHVTDNDSDDRTEAYVAGTSVALAIDRSQTPDWAKTVKPTDSAKRSVRKSPVHREPRRQAGEKWGKRAVVPQSMASRESLDDTSALDHTTVNSSERHDYDDDDHDGDGDRDDDNKDESESPLYIKQQSGELHQLDVPHSKEVAARPDTQRRSHQQPPETNLQNLSVGHVEIKALGTSLSSSSGSSLALEREQLEKRKKQIETANAVAAMNTRLLQLGLLKPHGRAAQDNVVNKSESGGERASVAADEPSDGNDVATGDDTALEPLSEEYAALEQSSSLRVNDDESIASEPELDRSDIPEEMLQSIDVSVLQRLDRNDGSARHTSERAELSAEASLSMFTTGFQLARGTNALGASVDIASAAVGASMSAFTTGYAGSGRDGHGVSVSQSIALPAVTASLSAFTTGYNTADDAVRASVAASVRVDESLSAFTSGFRVAGDANETENLSRASVDLTSGVGASMSAFITGYTANGSSSVAVTESIALPVVNASLSTFTTGYNTDGNAAASSALTRDSASGVSASLSVFTSGYEQTPASVETLVSSSVDDLRSHVGGVNESLSVFTTGYEVANQRDTNNSSRTTPSQHQDHSSGISNNGSDVPVDQSLSAFTVGYETTDASHGVAVSTASATAPVTAASLRKEAPQTSAVAPAPESGGSPEATVLSTISDLDQQLVTVAKTFDDLLPTDKSAAPEVQEIQHLVTQLRAAIERYSSTET